jgi:hypothetical protein
MNGIVGFNWRDGILLQKMMATIQHKRPDNTEYYTKQKKIRFIQFLNIKEKTL